jgi:predicted nucleic acid-binding protein
VSDFVLDASLALQWFLQDEGDREYALSVLAGMSDNRAIVPMLWFYEVGNGLLMAYRRKRISLGQIDDFLRRLAALGIEVAHQTPSDLLRLPTLGRLHNLTSYDAAYLAIAIGFHSPIATTDSALRKAAAAANVQILSA